MIFINFYDIIIYYSYLLISQMKRSPCSRNNKNLSIQKITIIGSNNVSINQSPEKKKTNKSVDQIKKKYRPPKKKLTNYNIVQVKSFNLKEQMHKCRERQVLIIKRNVALSKYYNCLITLFMVAYTSSQVLMSNFFQIRRKSCFIPNLPNQFGLNFINILLNVYQTAKNYQYEARLKKLAINLLKIAPTASEFERKIQFISRKVVLNSEKSKEIQMSFMNYQLQTFWKRLLSKIFLSSQIDFIEEMFELEPQKLCVKNFQQLINQYLSCQQFEQDLKYHNGFMEDSRGNNTSSHYFDIEFLLIEKLCTEEYDEGLSFTVIKQKEEKAKKSRCQIY